MGRRIFIGDIQGCRTELEQLLDEVRFDPAADELHPVGDFVNRGPDSLGVLALLSELPTGGVLGNHDLHALAVAAGGRQTRAGDTLDALLTSPRRTELLAWLARRPFLRAWPDLYLVHAGFHPAWSAPEAELAHADPLDPSPAARFAVRVRLCKADGTMVGGVELPPEDESPTEDVRPWDAWYESGQHGGRRIVFGHWAARGLVRTEAVLGLDTGCVWGGRLTAWIAEEDRLVSVPAARAYASIL